MLAYLVIRKNHAKVTLNQEIIVVVFPGFEWVIHANFYLEKHYFCSINHLIATK